MHSITAIHPYKHEGLWVFDDYKAGLEQEPLVAGADATIAKMVAEIPNAESGFILLLSTTPFTDHQIVFEWRREEMGGHWYAVSALETESYLCPSLFQALQGVPEKIYAYFKPKGFAPKIA
ncbi:MAG: DUF6717 family protein [Thermosynechococcaceae cyanobacterium]